MLRFLDPVNQAYTEKMKRFSKKIVSFVKSHFTNSFNCNDNSIIASDAGCEEQSLHTDAVAKTDVEYNQGEECNLSCILAMMEGTTLQIVPKSQYVYNVTNDEERSKVVHYLKKIQISIPPGHCLFFQTSFIHAGDAYTKFNCRTHYHIDFYERALGFTNIISENVKELETGF
jgi:ectoine hydroxylase-related dioxygenase (phytanoyl-CoA dioxygenase family)